MKIILFHTYNKGYLSSFFFELSNKLADEGYEIFNFSFKQKSRTFKQKKVSIIIEKKSGYISNYSHIYKIIKRIRPDVIVSNFSYVNPALLFGKYFRISNNVSWFHSLNDQTEATRSNILIKRFFLKLADTIIANSLHTKKELQSSYHISEEKIKAIPFWTDIEKFDNVQRGKRTENVGDIIRIGCPGRFVKHKNQDLILKALSLFKPDQKNNIRLFLAGRGDNKAGLDKSIKRYGLEKKITFCEHLSPSQMAEFYKAMHIVILPSLHEAFGLVFIEAIALGTPVLVSNTFGALTFIDPEKYNVEKFTFDPTSSEDLYNKLSQFLNDDRLPESYFKELYEANFNKELIYRQIKSIIQNI